MRLLPLLLLCPLLGGCMTDGSTGDIVPGAQAAAAAKPASAAAPAKKEEWWKEGGVTREKVSAMCWMKYEQGRKDMAVEKRADLVNKCVEETLKANPPSGSAAAPTVVR